METSVCLLGWPCGNLAYLLTLTSEHYTCHCLEYSSVVAVTRHSAGKPYTHAWANFVLMLYFLHALTILYIDGGERWLAGIELILTAAAFAGNILYARSRGKELGLKLKRLSKVEKEEKERFE